MQISEIRSNLQTGDLAWIAKAVGCSYPMVRAVLTETRTTDSILRRRIIKACEMLIESRKAVLRKVEAIQ